MKPKMLVVACLALLSVSAMAQQGTLSQSADCSMQRLDPLLAEFVRAKAANTGRSAVAAADLASASADLMAALDECGLKPSCPDPFAPPAPGQPDGR